MGVLQITSRLGAASAPWVAQWLRHFHTSLPFILMGALTATAAFLCFLLKETKGMQTAEVLEKTNTTQGEYAKFSCNVQHRTEDYYVIA